MKLEPDEGPRADVDLDASDPRVVTLLGDAWEPIVAFAAELAVEGVLRGLVGPREVPRLWERHLINSAAVAQLLPETGTLVDVGSGAGLPGVVLAAMRPSMRVVLLEPMERRVTWLLHVRDLTGLSNIEVVRGRAEDVRGSVDADVVTARAVAPMERLAGWTLPLLVRGGVLLALKGRQAGVELESAAAALAEWGGDTGEILKLEAIAGVEPTTVVRVTRTEIVSPAAPKATSEKAGGGKRSPRSTSSRSGRSGGR